MNNILRQGLIVGLITSTSISMAVAGDEVPPAMAYKAQYAIKVNSVLQTDLTGYLLTATVQGIDTNVIYNGIIQGRLIQLSMDSTYKDKNVKLILTNPDGVELVITTPSNSLLTIGDAGKTAYGSIESKLGTYKSYELKSGWNLMSSVVSLSDSGIKTFIDKLDQDNVSSIWSYSNDGTTKDWISYDVEAAAFFETLGISDSQSLKSIDSGNGYFINLKNNKDVTLSGSSVSQNELDLQSGWNLIGVVDNLELKSFISDISTDKLSSIWSYSNDGTTKDWISYDVEAAAFFETLGISDSQSLKSIDSGSGYFVNLKEASTISDMNLVTSVNSEDEESTSSETAAESTATQAEQQVVSSDKSALNLSSIDADSVKSNITLPSSGNSGSTITWASSDTTVVANDGSVTQPTSDKAITLTATITKGSTSDTKVFSIIVKAVDTTVIAVVLVHGHLQMLQL